MSSHLLNLLDAIHDTIIVPSLYPYFYNLSSPDEYITVMMKFLDDCTSNYHEGVWIWGTTDPIPLLSSDVLIQEWLDEWNSADGHQNAINETTQSLIFRSDTGYLLEIRDIITNHHLSRYHLTRNQCKEILGLMLSGTVFNHDGLNIPE